jgi:hypothetical protein
MRLANSYLRIRRSARAARIEPAVIRRALLTAPQNHRTRYAINGERFHYPTRIVKPRNGWEFYEAGGTFSNMCLCFCQARSTVDSLTLLPSAFWSCVTRYFASVSFCPPAMCQCIRVASTSSSLSSIRRKTDPAPDSFISRASATAVSTSGGGCVDKSQNFSATRRRCHSPRWRRGRDGAASLDSPPCPQRVLAVPIAKFEGVQLLFEYPLRVHRVRYEMRHGVGGHKSEYAVWNRVRRWRGYVVRHSSPCRSALGRTRAKPSGCRLFGRPP